MEAEFSKRLVALLKERNVSKAQLARELDVPRTNVDRWLKRPGSIEERFITKLAHYFDVTPQYLRYGITCELGDHAAVAPPFNPDSMIAALELARDYEQLFDLRSPQSLRRYHEFIIGVYDIVEMAGAALDKRHLQRMAAREAASVR